MHAHWCPVFSGHPVSSSTDSSTADTFHPPAPLPCVCFSSTALPSALISNAAFERLLGYSQLELRQQAMRRGSAIMQEWYSADSWWALFSLLASHALTDKRHGYRVRAFVLVRTRWGAELPCMLEKVITEGVDGYSQSQLTLSPLAQLTADMQHSDEQQQQHPHK